MIYDAVIIGAGPAGALLAYLLARRNRKTIVLDRARFPRYKACGGGLTMKAINLIPFDVEPVIESAASGGILAYKGKPLVKVDHERVVAKYVMRDKFDHYLITMAQEAGAEFVDDVSIKEITQNADVVTIYSDKKDISARFLAGADGVNSKVAKQLGLLKQRQTGIALEAELIVEKEALDEMGSYALFDFGAIPHGYGWIFPKRDHFSVGVFQASPLVVNDLKNIFNHFIDTQPILKKSQISTLRGHKIPLGGHCERLHSGNVLLVGDAANLADPWLGEGMYYALRSVRIAAEVLDYCLNGASTDLQYYTDRVNSEINDTLKHAGPLGKLVYAYPKFLSWVLSRSQIMQDAIFDTLRGNYDFLS